MLTATLLLFQLASSHGSTPKPPDVAPASGAATSVAGLSWTTPKGWAEGKGSAMRFATYVAPGGKGDEPAEVAVFYFGAGMGGSIEQNVERWYGQFEPEGGATKPSSEKKSYNGVPVTIVKTEGTYSAGMAMGGAVAPKKGYALRGAIAEGKSGNVFFKMTGPKKTIAAAEPALEELLKSLKKG